MIRSEVVLSNEEDNDGKGGNADIVWNSGEANQLLF